MTLGECLDKVRKLINYYSVAGEPIAESDPVQKDYTYRACSAIDSALKELARRRPTVRHAIFTQSVADEEEKTESGRRYHALPEDFGGVRSVTPSPRFLRRGLSRFYVLENGMIGFPQEFTGTVELCYTVAPRTVGAESNSAMALDAADDAAEAIPYFAAALLLLEEDPAQAQLLLDMYNDRLEELDGGYGRRVNNTLFACHGGVI